MPIDIRLLRNANDAGQVKKWQQIRRMGVGRQVGGAGRTTTTVGATEEEEEASSAVLVDSVIELDEKYRHSQKVLNQYKSSCRQQKQRPDTKLLHSYQKQCNELSNQLFQNELCKLSNTIDEKLFIEQQRQQQQQVNKNNNNNNRNNNNNNNHLLKNPYRRLIELGVWEYIGGNANLHQQQSNNNNNNVCWCWTGLGIKWCNALTEFLEQCLLLDKEEGESSSTTTKQQQQLLQHHQILQLPQFMELDRTDLNQMMGLDYYYCGCCSTNNTNTSQTITNLQQKTTITAPSWLGYLKSQYSDQTLGDKQLPKTLQYTTTTTTTTTTTVLQQTSNQGKSSTSISSNQNDNDDDGDNDNVQWLLVKDPREQKRETSFRLAAAANNRDASSSFSASSLLVETKTIHHLLILTSSTYYDSRQSQKLFANKLMNFYKSLLLLPTTTAATTTALKTAATEKEREESSSSSNNDNLVRLRSVPPTDLLPAEVSRIVIEGYYGERKRKKDINNDVTITKDYNSDDHDDDDSKNDWMILGYISNFSDYPSRACRIKNGNTNQQQQQLFCHVLQGTICSIPETMCWIASHQQQQEEIHNNNDNNNNNGDNNLILPSVLQDLMSSMTMIPQVKKLVTNKKGKLQIKDTTTTKAATPHNKQTTAIQPLAATSTAAAAAAATTAAATTAATMKKKAATTNLRMLDINTKVTTEQIRGEALSTPFTFLPFFDSTS